MDHEAEGTSDNEKKFEDKGINNTIKTKNKNSNMKEIIEKKNADIKKSENNMIKDSSTDEDSDVEKDADIKESESSKIKNSSTDEDSDVEKDADIKESESNKIKNLSKEDSEKFEDEDCNMEAAKLYNYRNMDVGSKDEDVEKDCSNVTYLAQQMISEEKLSQIDAIKLFNLKVQLRHTVPPQHKIETRAGSHMPTRKQIEQFKEIVTLKKGVYSADEDTIIVRNWKTFCKLHDWDVKNPKPFLHLRNGTNTHMSKIIQRRKFVQFLADGLPNRTLYSVYHRFKNLYENNLQRRYTPEEDEMIIDHLENNPFLDEKRKYSDLAKVLRRTRNSIWRHYQVLKKRRKLKRKER